MGSCLLHGCEDTSRLHNILGNSITPFDASGILLLDELSVLSLDCAVELAMGRVILQLRLMKGSLMATISTLPDEQAGNQPSHKHEETSLE